MERINKTINLYGATAHVFRHSYLTFLASINTNIKTIQAIAGHSDIQTTMNLYVHKETTLLRQAGIDFNRKITNLLTDEKTPNPLSIKGLSASLAAEKQQKR